MAQRIPRLDGVKLLIVDMDNTLCDTYHTLSTPQWKAVADAFEHKGNARYASVLRRTLGKQGFVATMRRLGMSAAEQRFALKVYDRVPVSKLHLFDDAGPLLRLDIPKVLVSRGNRNLQLKKIRHLGIRPSFDKIILVPTLERKERAFVRVLKEYGLKPRDALIIGDRIEDEIADGTRLGIPTCLVRRQDWPIHPGVRPKMTVWSLAQLAKSIEAARRGPPSAPSPRLPSDAPPRLSSKGL